MSRGVRCKLTSHFFLLHSSRYSMHLHPLLLLNGITRRERLCWHSKDADLTISDTSDRLVLRATGCTGSEKATMRVVVALTSILGLRSRTNKLAALFFTRGRFRLCWHGGRAVKGREQFFRCVFSRELTQWTYVYCVRRIKEPAAAIWDKCLNMGYSSV